MTSLSVRQIAKGIPFLFLLLVFLYPLAAIISRSLSGEGASPLAAFSELFGDSYYAGRLLFTFWQATLSTALTLLVGLPSAYVFAKYDFPGKALLRSLTTIPFVMPPIVMALGFIALVGPRGIVNAALMGLFSLDDPPLRMMNTLAIILLAHVIYEFAIVVRLVSAVWANLDPRLEASARVLGATPWTAFRRVTLPLLLPAIAAAAALVFLFTFTSFGVVLILGGSEYATLEVTIYNLTAKLFRLPLAAALALLQLALTFIILAVYARLQETTTNRLQFTPETAAGVPRTGTASRLVVVANAVVIFIVLSPLVALLARSIISDGSVSFAPFAAIFSNERSSFFYVSPLIAMRNSLAFAAATVAVALPLGLASAYALGRRRAWWKSPLDALLMLPLGVSAVTLSFGFLIAFNRPPIDLRATWLIVVLAHALVAYPFVLRTILPILRGMDPAMGQAARTLGASPARVFRYVDLPILARGLLVGATFAFAISLGEFGATLLLNRPEFTTMPIAIFRYLGQPGQQNLAEAMAMSGILMAVCALGFLLIERFRYRDVGVF